MRKESAILVIISFTMMPAIVYAQVCPTEMVSYWKFDESSGTTASDFIGTDDGTVVGGTWTSGVVGNALSFDGNDDYVELQQTFLFHQSTDATLMFWANRADNLHRSIFWTRGNNSDTNRFNIYTGTGAGGFGIDYRSPLGVLHGFFVTQTPIDQWVHYAITRSGNTYDLYIDGQLRTQATDTIPDLPNYTGNWFIGRRPGFMYKGAIDELALFSRSLPAEEVQQHYQNSLEGIGYCDGAADIPTLSQWGMIVMIGGVIIISLVYIRRRGNLAFTS